MNIDPPHDFIPGLVDKTKCRWSIRGHLCGFPQDMHAKDAIYDRWQRALESYWDATASPRLYADTHETVNVAIETATRVQITPEIEVAFRAAVGANGFVASAGLHRGLKAAFEAAGFEVEK